MFGRKSVYRTIAAVETFVDQHYQQQIDHIRSFGGPTELLSLLIKCQADEQEHRDESKGTGRGEIQFLHWSLVQAGWLGIRCRGNASKKSLIFTLKN
jgi:demethoxyubiquinone hydroxylase (CLK1/Coq7/Cat5 family)